MIDEAYHEFAGESAVPLLARHPNLVVLRTFSKAMGLAGLRVGYLLGLAGAGARGEQGAAAVQPQLLLAARGARGARRAARRSRRNVRRLVEGRERLLARLADCPACGPTRRDANFFLVEVLQADPKAVFDCAWRGAGVLVRDVTSYPRLARCLRVSVGTEEENDAFLHALGTALSEAGSLRGNGEARSGAGEDERGHDDRKPAFHKTAGSLRPRASRRSSARRARPRSSWS